MGVDFHHIRTRMKISETKKRQIAEQGGFTDEHKRAISEAHKRRMDRLKTSIAIQNGLDWS